MGMSIINAPAEFYFSKLLFKSNTTINRSNRYVKIRKKELECSLFSVGDEISIAAYCPVRDSTYTGDSKIRDDRTIHLPISLVRGIGSDFGRLYQFYIIPNLERIGSRGRRLAEFSSSRAVYKSTPQSKDGQMSFGIPQNECESAGIDRGDKINVGLVKKPSSGGLMNSVTGSMESVNRSLFRVETRKYSSSGTGFTVPIKRVRIRGYDKDACYQIIIP